MAVPPQLRLRGLRASVDTDGELAQWRSRGVETILVHWRRSGAFSRRPWARPWAWGARWALPIAIEFGTGSLKILQVAQGEPPSLVAAACLQTPDDLLADHRKRLEFQLEGLPRLIRRGGFKGRRAVCAIPAWQTSCKHFSVARIEGMPLAAQVQEAIAVQFGRDPSTILHRFYEMPQGDRAGKAEVVVTAVPRDLVGRLMKAIAASKLEPVGMHTEFTAVLRSFDHIHRRDADATQTTLYLDVGASTTKVMISTAGTWRLRA